MLFAEAVDRGCWLRVLVERVGWECWLRRLVEVASWACWFRMLVESTGWGCWLRGLVKGVGWDGWLRGLVRIPVRERMYGFEFWAFYKIMVSQGGNQKSKCETTLNKNDEAWKKYGFRTSTEMSIRWSFFPCRGKEGKAETKARARARTWVRKGIQRQWKAMKGKGRGIKMEQRKVIKSGKCWLEFLLRESIVILTRTSKESKTYAKEVFFL